MEQQVAIDLGGWAPWLSAAAAITAVVISVLGNIRGARKTELTLVHTRISAVKDMATSHGERLARVEAELEHLPTREMVTDLATSLARMEGKLEAVNAKFDGLGSRMTGIGQAVDQLVENELRGRGR
ncbi:MAG: DUF2730 family protein [Tistlia sp.]|uniref:DUF2730 family protein n=1 Tax=Tistlia sp. TaxID=3057121 RepID=UPI0034A3B94B